MPKSIQSTTYLYCNEAAKAAGISKATLLRWIENGYLSDSSKRDRNGWRLFSDAEVKRIKQFTETSLANIKVR
jgi:DNA-binding transcriptional MerR regulator